MKILKIEFRNINSLKGDQKIDFTAAPFTASSLFAITGPTGSGKSTILDVISLALFNQVPRLGKITRSEIISKGAILTRNQKEAFAKVFYECKHGQFCSEWNISTNRNNNLRDYEMHIYDLASNKALDLKKSDVPSKNEELIGLNYDQFIKSVLLAQGEFAQFLKAKKDERGELLEKITGTGIYRQLGIRAFQKKKEVSAEIEQQLKEIELLQKNLLPKDEFDALTADLSEKEEGCAPLENAIKLLEQHIQLKKNIQEHISRHQTHEKRKFAAQNELKNFDDLHSHALTQHEKMQILREDLQLWKQLSHTCGELNLQNKQVQEKQRINQDGLSESLAKIRHFTSTEMVAEKVEEELQNFSNRVQALQKQRDEKLSFYNSIKERFQLEVRDIPFSLNGDFNNSRKKLQELADATSTKIEELQNVLSNLDLQNTENERERLRRQLEQSRQAQQQLVKLENLSAEIVRLENEKTALVPQLKELPGEIELARAQVETHKERLEKLQVKRENELFRKSFEEYRHQLKDGQECPLCGALEHPFSQGLPQPEDGLQEQIRQTEKELDSLKNTLSTKHANLQHQKNQLEKIADEVKLKQQELESEKRLFEQKFREHSSRRAKELETLCAQIDAQLQHLEVFQQEHKKHQAISTGMPLLDKLDHILFEGKEIKEKLNLLYAGSDIHGDCLELQKSWTRLQHEQKSLKESAGEITEKNEKKRKELKELEEVLSQKIQQEGCAGIKEALQWLMPEQKYAELRKKREELATEGSRIAATLEMLSQQLKELRKKEEKRTSDELSADLEQKLTALKEAKNHCEELRRKLRNHRDNREQIRKIEKKISQKKQETRRWELLNSLIGDSTGKRFNDFAQDLNLTQLLQLANVRLKDLSDRYTLDKPVENEDDGLVAIDEHMGGQRRSVKTLSGGETFILSLSMALALSDLASKNVEINSLFIDEGFGTLDPETLDHTLDTLEKLQAESSKTIGVISHVDSLKERIATQIQLTRNGQGYSTLQVSGNR